MAPSTRRITVRRSIIRHTMARDTQTVVMAMEVLVRLLNTVEEIGIAGAPPQIVHLSALALLTGPDMATAVMEMMAGIQQEPPPPAPRHPFRAAVVAPQPLPVPIKPQRRPQRPGPVGHQQPLEPIVSAQ